MADPVQLRFTVLRHSDVEEPHYDLLLELVPGAALTTWRVPCWPITERILATKQADHRRVYLDYEGPVSGNRGRVTQIATGHLSLGPSHGNAMCVSLIWLGNTRPLHFFPLGQDLWEIAPA